MTTPRKHWFRVADSIKREAFSNDELAALIRIMAELNMRWARDGLSPEEACSALFGRGDLMECTGSGTLKRARSIVHSLSVHLSWTIEEQGTHTLIKWPKWAEFQELTTRSEGKPKPRTAPKLPPPQDARRKTQNAPPKRPKTASVGEGARDSPEPDIDPDDHGERIARKLRLGSKATPAERAEFVAAIFQTEVIPAARSEWSGRGSFWDVVTRILNARWNAYLNRERDPTRRAYYREASAREKRAALDRFEADQAALDPPDPPADPLLLKLAEIQSKRGSA